MNKHRKFTFDVDWTTCPTLEMLNSFVSQSADIGPALIKLNRKDYGNLLLTVAAPKFLPLSEQPRVLHVPTAYGFLPVLPSDNIPSGDIYIEAGVSVSDLFEKVFLIDEDASDR